MILLDSDVLVYALGDPHPLKSPAVALVKALANDVEGRTTVEVVQEFAYVYARTGRDRKDIVAAAERFVVALSPLIESTADDLRSGLRIWERHSTVGAIDSVLAAVAIRLDVKLVSADKGFRSIRRLRFVDLADPKLMGKILARD